MYIYLKNVFYKNLGNHMFASLEADFEFGEI